MQLTLRVAGILGLVLLIDACTRVGHIQRTEPVRRMNFAGSHKAVAECIHRRLGGKIQEDGFGSERYVMFDSAKSMTTEGLTHWSITVGKFGQNDGFAEWRIVAPAPSRGFQAGGVGPGTAPGLTEAAVKTYWGAVEECAARANR